MKRHRSLILLASAFALSAVALAVACWIGAFRRVPDPEGPAEASGSGNLYVLSVGVEPSLTAKGKRDPYAGDAWFVRHALAHAEPLYATTHSWVLAGPRATRTAVLDALDWLATSVGERDVAVVFFSTHGDVAPPGLAPRVGYYLDLAGAGGLGKDCVLWGSELNAKLDRVQGRTVLFMDTCSAAAAIPADGSNARRLAVVASCGAGEKSSGQWGRADRPHGWFVLALCEALNGSADANGDGVVTLGEVTAYVPARARRLYAKQNAVVSFNQQLLDLPLTRTDLRRFAGDLWPPEPPAASRDLPARPEIPLR